VRVFVFFWVFFSFSGLHLHQPLYALQLRSFSLLSPGSLRAGGPVFFRVRFVYGRSAESSPFTFPFRFRNVPEIGVGFGLQIILLLLSLVVLFFSPFLIGFGGAISSDFIRIFKPLSYFKLFSFDGWFFLPPFSLVFFLFRLRI